MGMPDIDIIFKQLAVTAIQRSTRGIAAIILRDDTAGEDVTTKKTYTQADDIEKTLYSDENLVIIKRCFRVAVNKVVVITIPTAGDFDDALAILKKTKYNYVCTTDKGSQQDLADYVLAHNAKNKGKKVKAVCWQVTVADDKHIINTKNTTVKEIQTQADGTKVNVDVAMSDYLPRMTSVLANLPMNQSITYYVWEDLAEVDDVETENKSLDDLVDEGWLFLWNDEDVVRCGRGVNSLTTFTSTDTKDMSHILIVETMDLILEDIYTTFKEDYIRKYKNYTDNQKLFIAAVNSYFAALAGEEILDPDYTGNDEQGTTANQAYIDIEAQRNAWLSIGKTAAKDWSDKKVESMAFKTTIFLGASVKILDAVEDLHFVINME